MAVGQVAGDGDAQAGAAVVAGAGVVEPDEAFEDAVGVLGRHAWSVVVHRDDDPGVLVPDVDLDAVCGVAGGVVDEVAQQSFVFVGVSVRVCGGGAVAGEGQRSFGEGVLLGQPGGEVCQVDGVGAGYGVRVSRRARRSRSSARERRRRVCRAAVVAAAGQLVRSGCPGAYPGGLA